MWKGQKQALLCLLYNTIIDKVQYSDIIVRVILKCFKSIFASHLLTHHFLPLCHILIIVLILVIKHAPVVPLLHLCRKTNGRLYTYLLLRHNAHTKFRENQATGSKSDAERNTIWLPCKATFCLVQFPGKQISRRKQISPEFRPWNFLSCLFGGGCEVQSRCSNI